MLVRRLANKKVEKHIYEADASDREGEHAGVYHLAASVLPLGVVDDKQVCLLS
jgi:hypothetical protein